MNLWSNCDDGLKSMNNNVIKNENSIRAENNLALQTDYYGLNIRWMPNSTPKIQNQGSNGLAYKATEMGENYK